MPELSIIVPIYNGEKFLDKCIDSILSQTFTDFEVILVDDGSTDNSLNICREYEQKDSRVVVYHKENAGLVAARKSGVEVSFGEYIGFVDCDDYIDKDMYAKLMETAKKDGSDIVIEGIIVQYPEEQKYVYNQHHAGFYDSQGIKNKIVANIITNTNFLQFGIIPGVFVKVFRRSVLEKALSFVCDNVNLGEDVAITSYSIMNAKSLSILESASYHYVQVDTSMIHKFDADRFNRICNLYNCISKIDNKDYQKQVNLYIGSLIFVCIAELVLKSGYSKTQIRKNIREMLNSELARKTLKNADTSRLSKKDKLKILLMRYKMVFLLNYLIK